MWETGENLIKDAKWKSNNGIPEGEFFFFLSLAIVANVLTAGLIGITFELSLLITIHLASDHRHYQESENELKYK